MSHHRFGLDTHRCYVCGTPMYEWIATGDKCRRGNRKERKRRVRWWRDFSKSLWLKPEEIKHEERARLAGHTFIEQYTDISWDRRRDFRTQSTAVGNPP